MRKLKILGIITSNSAVGFYRIYQPLKMLEKLGLAELKLTPNFNWGKTEGTKPFPDLKWFSTDDDTFYPDIIVAERHEAPQYIALINGIAKGYGVPLVMDTDDDVHLVRPYNPGYMSYNPNSPNLPYNTKLMSMPQVSAITVSTPQLKERHLEYGKPIYVVPNSIDLKTRSFPKKNHKGKIRIGWLGSACHYENLQIIRQAVADIVSNFPQVEFIFTNLHNDIWANPPKEVINRMKPICQYFGCKEYHPYCQGSYVAFDKYAKFINRLNLDIGLAPLYDNAFNRAKSNLRILEYWADKVAVVASPVREYRTTIKNGQNGLLAKERIDWYNSIKKLILDKDLRGKLQENGFKSLGINWSAEKQALKLYKVYKEIIKNHGRTSLSRIQKNSGI